VQIQEAVSLSLSGGAVGTGGVVEDANTKADKLLCKRPRDDAIPESVLEPKASEVLDDFGDADLADSDVDDDRSNTGTVLNRLKRKISSTLPVSKKGKKPNANSVESPESADAEKDDGDKETVSLTIPKKGSIPRRKLNNDDPSSQSSLLATIMKSAPTPIDTISSTSNKAISSTMHASKDSSNSFPKPFVAAPPAPAVTSSRALAGSNNVKTDHPPSSYPVQGPPRQQLQRSSNDFSKKATNADASAPSLQQGFPSQPTRHVAAPAAPPSQLERQALTGVTELCRSIRKRDARFQALGQVRSVDLGGSFLLNSTKINDPKRFDFFDTNERGEIVLQPRQPMFPEEFAAGMKDHSLSWWGILDPAVGDGKFQPPLPDPRSLPPPHHRQSMELASPHRMDNFNRPSFPPPSFPEQQQQQRPFGYDGSHQQFRGLDPHGPPRLGNHGNGPFLPHSQRPWHEPPPPQNQEARQGDGPRHPGPPPQPTRNNNNNFPSSGRR
jgi:hypothetical protein